MIYGNKLKELREEKNLKYLDLGNILNINQKVYGQYEREYTIIPIKHLNTLCDFYNVSIDYIFSFTDIVQYKNHNKDIDLNLIIKRLKEFRKDNKLTQIKIAKILNVANGTIANYERGRNIIATPFLYTICKKCNISADYLLGKIDNPKLIS